MRIYLICSCRHSAAKKDVYIQCLERWRTPFVVNNWELIDATTSSCLTFNLTSSWSESVARLWRHIDQAPAQCWVLALSWPLYLHALTSRNQRGSAIFFSQYRTVLSLRFFLLLDFPIMLSITTPSLLPTHRPKSCYVYIGIAVSFPYPVQHKCFIV